jgi:CotH kinase protein
MGPRGTSPRSRSLGVVLSLHLFLGACSDDAPDDSADNPPVDPGGAKGNDAARPDGPQDAAPLDGGRAPELDASLIPAPDAAVFAPVDAAPEAAVDAAVALDGSLDAGLSLGKQAYAETFLGDHLVEVKITLTPADWDKIRNEAQTVNAIVSNCLDPNFDYTKVEGSVSIDGQSFAKVSVRKKGYLGSLSVVRPSLKIGLDDYVDGQEYRGVQELTLNSARQDLTRVQTCLAYKVFGAAGLPVPGCTLARVSVNDQVLGVYTNVEPHKKPLLRRFYASDKGNLYEGNAGADLRQDSLFKFEKKTNESDLDPADLARVAAALEIPDDAAMLQQLEKVLDVEQYLRFWASESLVGHWDGYSGDLNNFYVYVDPATGKLNFLPYGPDSTFTSTHTFLPAAGRPPVTLAWARLPRRLWAYPVTRDRYRAVLRSLLDQAWDVSKLNAEIDRLIPFVASDYSPASVDALRSFIAGRRAVVEAELAADPVPWLIPERAAPACNEAANSKVSGAFTTTWDTLAAPVPNFSPLDLSLDGRRLSITPNLAGVGDYVGAGAPVPAPAVLLLGTLPDGVTTLTLQLLQSGPKPAPGSSIAFHGVETFGIVGVGVPPNFTLLGFIGDGAVRYDRYATDPRSPVTGRFDGTFTQFTPSPVPVKTAPSTAP